MKKTAFERFWEKVERQPGEDGCWLWTASTDKDGYGMVQHGGKLRRASRVAWALSHGDYPAEGLFVLHRCDQPGCVRPSHLFLGKPKDNSADMVAKSRQAAGDRHPSRTRPDRLARGDRNGARTHPERLVVPAGERNGMGKLTEAKVREIRRRFRDGEEQADIAAAFGVTQAAVSMIVTGKRWKHVTDEP